MTAIDDWRVSFEAKVDGFTISPPGAESLPGYHTIRLPKSTSQHRQSAILRPDDCIRLNDEFESTLKIEDIKVDSSIRQRSNEESYEVPETQQRQHATTRRTHKPSTTRTTVQVEHSMQGSHTLPSATPAQPTQQSLIVAETPATHRKLPMVYTNADDALPKTVDPKELVSTNVSTPSAVKDSFAERPRSKTAHEHILPSLELGSSLYSDQTAEPVKEGEEESEPEQEAETGEVPEYETLEASMVREARRSRSKTNDARAISEDASMREPSSDPRQAMDVGTEKAEPSSNATNQRRSRRAKPEPQVRIPVSRNTKKRASPANVEQGRPTKKNKKAKGVDESDDSFASSIVVRVDRETPNTASVPSSRPPTMKTASEHNTPTRSQSPQRSVSSVIHVASPYRGKAPRVAFSNTKVVDREGSSAFLRKSGVQSVDKVTEICDIVCIGSTNGSLLKSAKLLLGLALGKTIASDKWVLRSRQEGKLLDPSQFPPLNAPSEWGWGDDEERVNKILNIDRSELFKDKVMFFTSATRKEYGNGFGDIEKIVKACGAKIISKSAREYKHAGNNIILATDHGDLEVMALMGSDRIEGGHPCYSKELISMSVLRGSLDLENEEFKIQLSSSQPRKGKKPSARKAKGA
ncbi:brct domain protein [Diplodia corticola]|uniref:Brct domain protein n=1 Tax=Diplodia corticola TaxID=236234 RepID=A0A1J9RNX5_9PEZI|nr:brct domain protein [Diplodia corticola]OJD34251.1 brct domain protein [Diplodia corticola]